MQFEFEIIAKALLYLLKSDFMCAFDHDEMRKVFLEKACKLKTSNIQSAYMHLSSGRKENEIPFLNKNSAHSVVEKTNAYYTQPNEIEKITNAKKSNLTPIGIKDIHLFLTMPMLTITSDFDPNRLVVEVNIFSGKFKLSSDETTSVPIVLSVKPSINTTKVFEMAIKNEQLIFDLSTYDKDRFGNNDIVAIIAVKYQTDSK